MNYTPHAYVIWRGPSLIDGAPLIVAVTGANLRAPVVWVFSKHEPLGKNPIRDSIHAGRYVHRAPFALPGYVLGHGRRESVPGEVWATLEGRTV